MKILLIAIGIYFLYRFITGFVIPVMRTTNQIKQQFGNIKTGGNTRQNTNANQSFSHQDFETAQKTTSGKPGRKEDYIEFEEVKS